MSFSFLLIAFELERAVFRLAMIFLCLHFLRAIWLARRTRTVPPPPLPSDRSLWPLVTVQLPMRNEFYVAERALRAAAALDYPRDKLQIQVLDDSDDETRARIDGLAKELCAGGTACEVVRRVGNEGYKGGALANGLRTARGELVAIFDADCVPAPDFLIQIVPSFLADPKVGMVQGSWSFLNRTRSFLTRTQAAMLDGLMQIEQPARSSNGRPFQFNGTAGMWRRACIESVGGWRSVSIAEDLELSFRALLQGWRFVQRSNVAVPTELPETFGALRAQQRRWAQGSAQALSVLGSKVARGEKSKGDRVAMLLHMARRLIHVFLAIWMVTLPLTTFSWMPTLINDTTAENVLVFSLVIISVGSFLTLGQRLAGVPLRSALFAVPLAIGMYIALSFALAIAFISGLFRRGGAFVRTPKQGHEETEQTGPRYVSPFDWVCVFESLAGLAYAGFVALAISRELYFHAAFFSFMAAALLTVGLGSLAESVRPARAVSP